MYGTVHFRCKIQLELGENIGDLATKFGSTLPSSQSVLDKADHQDHVRGGPWIP